MSAFRIKGKQCRAGQRIQHGQVRLGAAKRDYNDTRLRMLRLSAFAQRQTLIAAPMLPVIEAVHHLVAEYPSA